MNITFHQLKVLNTVVEEGGITKASKALFMTQPAVSNTLKTLEERVGMPLTQRVNKRFEPTFVGQLILEFHHSISDKFHELQNKISAAKGGVEGKMRVGCVTTAKYILPNLLHDFMGEYPNIQVDIEIVNKKNLIEHLVEKRVDCAILSHPPNTFDVQKTKIIQDRLVLICAPDEPLQTVTSLTDLKIANWLIREVGSGTRMSMLSWFEKMDFVPKQTMLVNDTESIKQLVMAGFGISMVPESSVQSELKAGTLKVLRREELSFEHNWYMTTLPKGTNSILLDKLLGTLEVE